MIPVSYRWTASRDIRNIRLHYEAISLITSKNVMADIYESIAFLQLNPEGGVKIRPSGVRRTVTSKHQFTITYIPSPAKIEIIGVFRYQNRNV